MTGRRVDSHQYDVTPAAVATILVSLTDYYRRPLILVFLSFFVSSLSWQWLVLAVAAAINALFDLFVGHCK